MLVRLSRYFRLKHGGYLLYYTLMFAIGFALYKNLENYNFY